MQGCTYGCLGLGDCVRACKYDAIAIIDGLAVVDYDKCVGCGACQKACPRGVISMVPFKASRVLVVACNSRDFGKDVKAVCKVGCIGCGICAKFSEVFTIEDNLARIDYDRYDPADEAQVAKAVEKCPVKRLIFVGEPTAEDVQAVAGEELPSVVEGRPKNLADKTDWHG